MKTHTHARGDAKIGPPRVQCGVMADPPGVHGKRGPVVQGEVNRVGVPPGPFFRLQHRNRHVGRAGKVPRSACVWCGRKQARYVCVCVCVGP